MAEKPKKKCNPDKEHMSVRSSNNENSSHPNSQMKLQSRPTMRPSPAVYNTNSYIPKFTTQTVGSLMDDTFKLNYEELKNKPMPFMLPPQWERPLDYQKMAGDGAIHSGQEEISTSDSESEHTNLEEVGVVCVKHISSSENLKVRMILYEIHYKNLFTAIPKCILVAIRSSMTLVDSNYNSCMREIMKPPM